LIVYDVQDLVKFYQGQSEPANRGITLQIQQGEIFGLLGDNGAGKTTLVRQMVNLLRSTSGSITLFGEPIAADPQFVPANVGYMPQETHSLNTLTVGEALYFTAHLRGMSRTEARQERDRLLDLWQIEELRNQDNSRLSGGQRRLLRLAVAMAGSLPVLILDEPTNDLDPLRRRLVWDVLRQINRERGTTIIFITHDAIEAEKVIERVGIMRDGGLVALGRPSDLKRAIDRKLRLELFCAPDAPLSVDRAAG
jgi:ABC-2 type transport system ATP-binding protein